MAINITLPDHTMLDNLVAPRCVLDAGAGTSLAADVLSHFQYVQGGTGADDGMAPGGPIRNVQSMHTFYPQPGPGGPPQSTHGQDGARPHSWDNSNANVQLNNLQNLLGSQQILQQIASLNQQQVKYMPIVICA